MIHPTPEVALDWERDVSPESGWINPRLGTRFDDRGRFLPEAGNTVVCQVKPGSATERALTDFRAALSALPEADLFAFTPPESWHMTVFEGVVETRRDPHHWPAALDPAATIDSTTQAMAARLEGFIPPAPFRMRITAATPFGLTLTGATVEDEAHARLWRDTLASAFRLHRPGHDAYRFHITLAYVKRALPSMALPIWRTALQDWTERLQDAVPMVDLMPSGFCRFADMCAFPPLRMLD
ncbi:MAG: hypothetical protein CFE34_06405 [Rhodobacteraceae bacterium PARR1]|nr:MAG: hypothetical protein CFE34_06405 [Rhodobacteraceae bacterium PARR1]